jgi:hypothetical protein
MMLLTDADMCEKRMNPCIMNAISLGGACHIGSSTLKNVVFRRVDDIANYSRKLFACLSISRLAKPRAQE